MSAAKPYLRRRPRVASSTGSLVGAVAALVLGPLACAGPHHISQAPPHPIAVEIQNNLTVPTELTVYITQDRGGLRQMLGTVPGDKTMSFNYTPVSWDLTYRLVGERPLGRPVVSPPFVVNDPNTGAVTWAVIPNQVQFYDLPEQQRDTTKAAPPAPADTTHH